MIDTMGKALWASTVIVVILILFLIGLTVEESRLPTFELRKDEWTCTKEVTRLRPQYNGKTTTMIPHRDCIQWSEAT